MSSNNVIYWSPDSTYIAYLRTSDEDVQHIKFSTYFGKQYPEMVRTPELF